MSVPEESLANRYRIMKPLGAGGMGAVYLAEDARLGRKVALKILPAESAVDENNFRRFEQEARAASSLNHPNIITIYEIGALEIEGRRAPFISTEFVEGATLRERLRDEPPTIEESVKITAQIAAALDAAHRAGVVHRDIKPENVMLRADGIVKVLDFGLAKLLAPPAAHAADTEATTQFNVFTAPGVVLGTTPYMSPEQARGLDVDARSDLFSLGAVMYEMVAGKLPFDGRTKTDVLISIVEREPAPLARFAPDATEQLQRIVNKALRKEPDERYHTAKDFLIDLNALGEELRARRSAPESVAAKTHAVAAESSARQSVAANTDAQAEARATQRISAAARKPLPLALAALALLALVALAFYLKSRVEHFAPAVPQNLTTKQIVSWKSDAGEFIRERGRFSADGKAIAFASSRNGTLDIWVKQLASDEPVVLQGTRDEWRDYSPVWSPDGQRIAFISDRSGQPGVWIVPSFGGTPAFAGVVPPGSELVAWSSRAQTIFYSADDNLYSLDLDTKQSAQITKLDSSRRLNRRFALDPDEKMIAYDEMKENHRAVWVAPLRGDAAAPKRITDDSFEARNPVWMRDGKRILFNAPRDGAQQIFVAYLDGGAPAQITYGEGDCDLFDVSSDDSSFLYSSVRDEADVWSASVDAAKEFQITSDVGVEFWADAAPDGKRIVYQAKAKQQVGAQILDCALYVAPIGEGGAKLRLSDEGFYPQWSPAGKWIAFLRIERSLPELWISPSAGGAARRLTQGGVTFGGFSNLPFRRLQTRDYQWSPDSRSIVYCAYRNKISDVRMVGIDDGKEIQIARNSDAGAQLFCPAWSPDGKRVAYVSRRAAQDGKGGVAWEIIVAEDGESKRIFQSDSVAEIIGWDKDSLSLFIKSAEGKSDPARAVSPGDVSILKVSVGGASQTTARLSSAYFNDIQLLPDASAFAYVAREESADAIRLMSARGGASRKVIGSSDPRVYLSGVAWSRDGKTLRYSKQLSWRALFIVSNFK